MFFHRVDKWCSILNYIYLPTYLHMYVCMYSYNINIAEGAAPNGGPARGGTISTLLYKVRLWLPWGVWSPQTKKLIYIYIYISYLHRASGAEEGPPERTVRKEVAVSYIINKTFPQTGGIETAAKPISSHFPGSTKPAFPGFLEKAREKKSV